SASGAIPTLARQPRPAGATGPRFQGRMRRDERIVSRGESPVSHRATLKASACNRIRGPLLVCGGRPHTMVKEQHISETRINERIRVSEVRLVGPNGEQVGIVRVEDALRLAAEADLDLVEVAPDARPPV